MNIDIKDAFPSEQDNVHMDFLFEFSAFEQYALEKCLKFCFKCLN